MQLPTFVRATLSSLTVATVTMGLVACGGALPAVQSPAEEEVVHATATVVTPTEASNIAELFAEALSLLSQGRAEEAARSFELVASADTTPTYALAARFNAGIAWEQAGDEAKAAIRYEETIESAPDTDLAKSAAIRASRLFARGAIWGERLSGVADYLLSRGDLTEYERLEALGAKGLALVAAGEVEAAERKVVEARNLIDQLGIGMGGQLPTAVAQVQFTLGEIRKAKSERIVFVPLPADFADALERRCQGLLDAQSAYTDAMRSLDPHWAAMSGFRVGQLYQGLYDDLAAMTPPPQADTPERRALFEAALRLRYRILLEKGLKMMEHTVRMGERTNEAAEWTALAREARDDLLQTLAEEKEALRRLPYTEDDLQRALEALEKGSRPSM